jgi:hypothetical protein
MSEGRESDGMEKVDGLRNEIHPGTIPGSAKNSILGK